MAVDSRAQVEQRMQRLEEFHAGDLPPRQALVLVLQAAGCTDAEVAEAMTTSLHTVRNQARLARAKVTPPDVAESRGTAVAWVWLHRECCVSSQWQQVSGNEQQPMPVVVASRPTAHASRPRKTRVPGCMRMRRVAGKRSLAVATSTLGVAASLVLAILVVLSAPDGDRDETSVANGSPGNPTVGSLGYLSSVAAGDNMVLFDQVLPLLAFGDTAEARMEAVSSLVASGRCTALPPEIVEAFGTTAVLDCSAPYRELQSESTARALNARSQFATKWISIDQ